MDIMAEEGIQTRPGTHAVHRLSYYAEKYAIAAHEFPMACEGEDLTIALPLFVGMTESEQEQVVKALRKGLCTSCLEV
jgi:dTDP-4-amino-4,6-dideoxygalactose transaminase